MVQNIATQTLSSLHFILFQYYFKQNFNIQLDRGSWSQQCYRYTILSRIARNDSIFTKAHISIPRVSGYYLVHKLYHYLSSSYLWGTCNTHCASHILLRRRNKNAIVTSSLSVHVLTVTIAKCPSWYLWLLVHEYNNLCVEWREMRCHRCVLLILKHQMHAHSLKIGIYYVCPKPVKTVTLAHVTLALRQKYANQVAMSKVDE